LNNARRRGQRRRDFGNFRSSDAHPSDVWGKDPSADQADQTPRPLQTVQSKFLEAVKKYAEQKYLELVVDLQSPNSGYGYVQKKDEFSNLYSFHFEFKSASAVFYLATDKRDAGEPAQRREAEFKNGADMDLVLTELRAGIDKASRTVYPGLGALSGVTSVQPDSGTSPTPLTSLSGTKPPIGTAAPTARDDAARVWGQDKAGTTSDITSSYKRGSRIPTIIATVVVLSLLFLFFVPVLQTSGTVNDCPPNLAACPASDIFPGSYYASVAYHYFGVGAEYFPGSDGWLVHAFFGVGTGVHNGTVYGFAYARYYFII
jgi:hypothetical protein